MYYCARVPLSMDTAHSLETLGIMVPARGSLPPAPRQWDRDPTVRASRGPPGLGLCQLGLSTLAFLFPRRDTFVHWSKSHNSSSSERGVLLLFLLPLLLLLSYLLTSHRPYVTGATRSVAFRDSRPVANSIIAKYACFIISRPRQIKFQRLVDKSMPLYFDPRRRDIESRLQRANSARSNQFSRIPLNATGNLSPRVLIRLVPISCLVHTG